MYRLNGIEGDCRPMPGRRNGSYLSVMTSNDHYALHSTSSRCQHNPIDYRNGQPRFTSNHIPHTFNGNINDSARDQSSFASITPAPYSFTTNPFNHAVVGSRGSHWRQTLDDNPIHYASLQYNRNNADEAPSLPPFNNRYNTGNSFKVGFAGIHQLYGLKWCPCCLPTPPNVGPMNKQTIVNPMMTNYGTYQRIPAFQSYSQITPSSLQSQPLRKKRNQAGSNVSISSALNPTLNPVECDSLCTNRNTKRKRSNPFGLPDDSDDVICHMISFCDFRSAVAIASTNNRLKLLVHRTGLIYKGQLYFPIISESLPLQSGQEK